MIALVINLGSYFFSDKLALASCRAKPIEESEAPRLYQIMRELTTRAGLPMPRLYMIPSDQPNAFATGRNPKHSAVAVTRGITKLLSEDELRGVLGHELTHVRNRDILIQSVASAIGTAITYVAYMLLWFGDDDNSPLGLVAALGMVILAPIAASIIQLAISRQREYAADAGGAELCGNPESLASALLRLESGRRRDPDAGEPGGRAALHRAPVQGQGHRRPLLHPPADRRAGPQASSDAPLAVGAQSRRARSRPVTYVAPRSSWGRPRRIFWLGARFAPPHSHAVGRYTF